MASEAVRDSNRARWSLAAYRYLVSKRLAGKTPKTLESLAAKSWEIAPAETSTTARAKFLPGQLERVTDWAFASEHPRREMEGCGVSHAATRAFLIKDVWMLDGALYKDDAYLWLLPRSDRLPQVRADREIERAALFCTAMGNKYFGQWLMDDCVTYPLAEDEGLPVMTDQPLNAHTPAYEDWLDMRPERLHNAFFRELVVFEDFGQNSHKHRRFRSLGDKLRSRVEAKPHPGVFILRGSTGEKRLLRNELELAEGLRDNRGFRIVDPSKTELPAIVAACAGARTVVGVEGSGLIHGVLLLERGASILTLQPPNRFVTVFKHLADRDGQDFGFVVGIPEDSGFRIDPEELERTLDLFPA
jgi:hypothetical protein